MKAITLSAHKIVYYILDEIKEEDKEFFFRNNMSICNKNVYRLFSYQQLPERQKRYHGEYFKHIVYWDKMFEDSDNYGIYGENNNTLRILGYKVVSQYQEDKSKGLIENNYFFDEDLKSWELDFLKTEIIGKLNKDIGYGYQRRILTHLKQIRPEFFGYSLEKIHESLIWLNK